MLSVFGRRIKGMIRLRPEQVWTCNTHTHTHTPTHYKTHTQNRTLQNPHIHTPTHYKPPHTHTQSHITKPTHTHTHPHITKHTHNHTLQNPHTHTHTQTHTHTHTHAHTHAHTHTHTRTHTHTPQNQLKQTQYKIHTKWNSHNTIQYTQYTVPKNFTVPHITSFQNKITSYKSRQFTPHHITSLLYTQSPLELNVRHIHH
jgi:hypothetical protein